VTQLGSYDVESKSGGPCFKLDTFGQKEYMYDLSESDTRERYLGVSNRVVGGVLIHTTRAAVVGRCQLTPS
jgi:hypothetical protein